MKIGIIGTGNIGGTIARKMKAAGHDVFVANADGLEGVRKFADEIGAKAVDIYGAVNAVDAIVLSVPLPAVSELPRDLLDAVPQDVPVVDTSNYYPGLRDARVPEIDDGMTESVWVSRQLGRPVIKAFNNVLAYSLQALGLPVGQPGRLAMAVAGDEPRSKQIVMSLVDQAGFDPVDAGSREDSWRQQPSTPAYCCDYDAETLRRALAATIKGQAAGKRDQMPEHFAKLGANPSHEDIIAMNRSVSPLQ